MDYERAEAFRDRIRAGMTTAEAVRARSTARERSLDTAEGTHRAQVMATEAEPPTEAEKFAGLIEYAADN